ncbi:2-deoxy-D-gluconate 3-dehydrogenase [Lipingzhangella halophila]|uniref:2-deoxy-D-gluconate 3-dehydrogenase n=1 Tax=Lipingzhangella halophila TaxID=1783352 RepID=A0A7W7W627_9ACTN|nr:glucose 1-dehydrogenase [Lipingzhangella halophila]MBB4935296.1 2-deoxy-D-gluconate 3-dehydrogenase [Lipingzhangella halophila]
MSTEQPLADQVAVVTGAGRGIGRAAALALAEAGAHVVLAARSADQLEAVASEVRERGRRALAVPTDVTDEAAVEELTARTLREFSRVDVLVNNSGILASTPLLEQSPEEWDAVHATNVRGTFLVTRSIGRHLVDQGRGKVINIASNFAFTGVPMHAAYCSSKAAVVALTRSLAVEWARKGVQVNAIAPGYFATDLNADARADQDTYERILRGVPARRMGDVDELSPWLVLLAGPSSDFMTGETIVIDGGQTAR